jgi:flagellar protein FlaG
METKVTAFAATPDATFGQKPTVAAAAPSGLPAAPAQPDPALDLRLVIEEDQASGMFVYKTINRLTGEVVSSLPRAEILRLRTEARYAAGAVVKTTA